MDKENFKIGDKVRLCPDFINSYPQNTKIGVVKEIDSHYIRVWYEGCGTNFPYLPREIEHIVKVGEQLLFSFMKGD